MPVDQRSKALGDTISQNRGKPILPSEQNARGVAVCRPATRDGLDYYRDKERRQYDPHQIFKGILLPIEQARLGEDGSQV